MKYLLILIGLALFTQSYSQDDASINLMDTDDTWRKEAFTFPKPFAPEVDFDGVADVRFTHGWSKKESEYLWAYAFAWKIELDKKLTNTELEDYLQLYFDGLMNVVNRDTSLIIPATNAVFVSENTTAESTSYKGKIKLYDAFFTKHMISLNVNGEHGHCTDTNTHHYIFRLSPQAMDSTMDSTTEDSVWTHLNKATLRSDICKE